MRDLFFKLFADSYFQTGISITPFSLAHIFYIVLIFGGTFLGWIQLHKKDSAKQEKLLRFLAYFIIFLYISDFFTHEFVYGGLKTDKLPFHVCTILCPLIGIAQFNHNGHKIKEPIAALSVLAPMMYLCYPASVGSGEPWCYQAVQTMLYHGALMAWGVLSIAFGFVKPEMKRVWKSGVLLVCITLWAKFGNILMEHNWFFLEEDALYIGLVEQGIIPKWVLMIVNPVIFFCAILALYGICIAIRKKTEKKTTVTV